jgi:transposase
MHPITHGRKGHSMEFTASVSEPRVTIGVDTHKHFHVAHAADQLGRALGTYTMPTTSIGYRDFLAWAQRLGDLQVVGIEGIGHYGAGLGRALRAAGVRVTEVGRPNRQRRARHGKTDSVDAAGAVAIVLAGEDLGEPKTADGFTEMLRVLRIARISAVRARAKAFAALKDLIVTAPAELRERLAGRHKLHLIGACVGLTTSEIPCTPAEAVTIAVKSLAERCLRLDAETKTLDQQIEALTTQACPELRQVYGVGPDTAATLLVALGDNPERIGSDAAFAKLCGVAPVEASSGKTVRHRLNRGGNRDANRALHVVCVVRLRRHQPTRDYLARRTAEGRTKPEIMRCIKRYIAREVYHAVLPTRQEIPTQTIAPT